MNRPTVCVAVRLTPEDAAQIAILARQNQRSQSDEIRRALRAHIAVENGRGSDGGRSLDAPREEDAERVTA